MRFHVNAIFALQTRQGLVFGCAREIDGDHLVFQVPGSVATGEVLDWRMQLAGRPEAVSGALRIESQRPGPAGEHPIFDGRIIAMTEQNRTLMQSWLVERSGSTSRDGLDASRFANQRSPPRLGSSVRKAVGYRLGGAAPRPAGTSSGKRVEPAGGREAISAAIKQSLLRTTRAPTPAQRLVAPSEGPRPEPARAEPPAPRVWSLPPQPVTEMRLPPPRPPAAAAPRASEARPVEPRPPAPRSPAPSANADASARQTLVLGADPQVGVKTTSRPFQILVRWKTAAAYARDHGLHLCGSGLMIPPFDLPELRERGTRALVRLELPGGAAVVCKAEVVAQLQTGIGLMLFLSAEQHQTLSGALGRA